MKALVLALFALILASVMPASAQDVVSQVNLPDRQVGDTWQYSYRDTRRNKPGAPFSVTVTEVMADGGFAVDIGGQKFFFGKGAGGVTTAAKSLEFAFPVKVGEKATYKTGDDAQGLHWDYDITREVVAVEKVEVPAGMFDAYKIVFVNKYVVSDGSGSSKRGTVTDTWWYAPAVENFVKRTFSDDGDRAGSGLIIRELLEYQIK